MLVIGQVVSGIGAAAVLPASLALVAAGTHNPRDRSRALAVWGAGLVSGAFVSPAGGLNSALSCSTAAGAMAELLARRADVMRSFFSLDLFLSSPFSLVMDG